MARVIIVVDEANSPSTKIDDKPAWKAQLFTESDSGSGEFDLTDEEYAIEAVSIAGPAGACGFALMIYEQRQRRAANN